MCSPCKAMNGHGSFCLAVGSWCWGSQCLQLVVRSDKINLSHVLGGSKQHIQCAIRYNDNSFGPSIDVGQVGSKQH